MSTVPEEGGNLHLEDLQQIAQLQSDALIDNLRAIVDKPYQCTDATVYQLFDDLSTLLDCTLKRKEAEEDSSKDHHEKADVKGSDNCQDKVADNKSGSGKGTANLSVLSQAPSWAHSDRFSRGDELMDFDKRRPPVQEQPVEDEFDLPKVTGFPLYPPGCRPGPTVLLPGPPNPWELPGMDIDERILIDAVAMGYPQHKHYKTVDDLNSYISLDNLTIDDLLDDLAEMCRSNDTPPKNYRSARARVKIGRLLGDLRDHAIHKFELLIMRDIVCQYELKKAEIRQKEQSGGGSGGHLSCPEDSDML